MAQVSRNKLPKKTWNMIWDQLIKTVSQIDTSQNHAILFGGLLTKTEEVMIAKRLMVCLLVISGWGAYDISRLLKMSTSTIYRIKNIIEINQAYQNLLISLFPKNIPKTQSTKASDYWDYIFSSLLSGKSHAYKQIRKNIFG